MDGKKGFRIIFMGTPEFAVPCLQALHESDFNVVAVITATDKYGGRGKKKLLQSAVKRYAVKKDIPVLQPRNLKSPEFLEELASYRADLQLVVAFRMLPVVVWDMPPKGTINLHASLLPKYRGAAPIHWAIINGESETGLTTFKLKHAIDTGDLIDQTKIPIHPDDTMGSLAEKMSFLGAKLLMSTTEKVYNDEIELQPQNLDIETKPAPKIYFEDAQIIFDQPTSEVYNFIRGMNPFPAAWTKIDGKVVKVFSCQPNLSEVNSKAGSIRVDNNKLFIQTQDGEIEIQSLKMEGKRKMETTQWLNGYEIRNERVEI